MSGQVTITQLPTAAALTGSEAVPVVQNGVTVQTTAGAISGAGALNYPFLTVGGTSGLSQARYLSASTGLSLSDSGVGGPLTINMTGAGSSLNAAGTGMIIKDSASTVATRQIAVGAGMTVSNATGVSGNPTLGLSTNLQNLSSLSSVGLVAGNGSTFSEVTITGTAGQIGVSSGDGSSGGPAISIVSNPTLPGTGGVIVPSGTTAQRSSTNGTVRYNTNTNAFEGYANGAWVNLGSGATGGGTVTSVSFTGGLISVGTPTSTPALTVAGTSGGVVYFSGGSTWASSAVLAANALVIGGGAGVAPATVTTGTGVVTALGVNTNAASGIVVKDANNNITANAYFSGFTSVAASGSQVTLTAASTPVYLVTGSGGQVIQLPNATTLPVGTVYSFNNNQSSGAITVNNNSTTLVVSVPSGGYTTVVLTANGNAAGTWDRHDQTPSNVSWSTNTFSYPGTITGATWNSTNSTNNYFLGNIGVGTGKGSPAFALDVNGTVSATYNAGSTATGLTAAGTNLATALVLAAQYNVVSTTALSTGVALPSVTGVKIWVYNAGTNSLTVYPPSGTVNGSASFTLATTLKAQFVQVAAGVWYSV